jgi:SAM-dependent methyltransferase
MRAMSPALQSTVSHSDARTRAAWSAFWQEPGQSRCVAGASEMWGVLDEFWSSFSRSLPAGTRVLELGCGAGAVARMIASARADVSVTGIDFARIPFTFQSQVDLLSETAMESLPFEDRSFGAVVSQFGFEYSRTEEAARETARVLLPGARLRMLVHHANSSIVASNRERSTALQAFLAPTMRSAFCNGDAAGLEIQLAALAHRHPADALVAELRRSLPSRLGRAARERGAIWSAIEDALEPERCLAESLNASCVAPGNIGRWLAPARAFFELAEPVELRDATGVIVGWHVQGCRIPS